MEGQRYNNQPIHRQWRQRFDWDVSGKLLVYSAVVGLLAGLLAAAAFSGLSYLSWSVQHVYATVGIELPAPTDYTDQTGPLPPDTFSEAERKDVLFGTFILPRYWILIVLVPAFGGLLCGLIVWTFAPEASGEGTDCMIRTFHFRGGFLRNRVPVVKTLAGFFTLGSGGSAGWEGPVMLLGAGLSGGLSKLFRLNVQDRRTLLLCGAAGGIGAIFQIPFGGALFAVEILYASTALELSAILPCVIASIFGATAFHFCHSDFCQGHVLHGKDLLLPDTVGINQPTDLLFFLAFVPVIAVCGLLFVRIMLETRNRLFRRLALPEFFKPALGGGLLGLVALVFPQVLGGGYEWMQRLLEGQLPLALILGLIIPKMLATAFTVSSGGSGGLLAPSLFLGGLIGAALGHLSALFLNAVALPGLAPDVATCTLIGMATFYAGIGKLPLAAAVIVCEMTGGDFSLLVPLIALNLLHLAIQSPTTSLYEEQVLSHVDSEAHFGNFSIDLLKSISVKEVLGSAEKMPLTISFAASIPDSTKLIAARSDSIFPVLDEQENFIGILRAGELWAVFRTRTKWDKQSAGSLMKPVPQTLDITVRPDDHLYKALRLCTLWQVSELPVVDPKNAKKLLGMLHHHEIIAAYNERLACAKWD